jgi:hypothetical protein
MFFDESAENHHHVAGRNDLLDFMRSVVDEGGVDIGY